VCALAATVKTVLVVVVVRVAVEGRDQLCARRDLLSVLQGAHGLDPRRALHGRVFLPHRLEPAVVGVVCDDRLVDLRRVPPEAQRLEAPVPREALNVLRRDPRADEEPRLQHVRVVHVAEVALLRLATVFGVAVFGTAVAGTAVRGRWVEGVGAFREEERRTCCGRRE
jgi:hypothetical protein